jgi:hypothetical protein
MGLGTALAYIILTVFAWLEHEMLANGKRPEAESESPK